MFFGHRMWDSESERIGKLRCTPLGYALHVLSDIAGFVGLLLTVGLIPFGMVCWLVGTFSSAWLWLFAVPLALVIMCEVLYHVSWRLAMRKRFYYDGDAREASWFENGERVTFTTRRLS
jgi:hypothetical protein